MIDLERPEQVDLSAEESGTARSLQFSMGTLMLFMVSFSLLLSYARMLGAQALIQAIVFCAISIVVGSIFGVFTRRWNDSLFWSILVTLLAFLATAGGRLPNQSTFYGWGGVAAICGGLSTLSVPKQLAIRSMLMAALSFATMIGVVYAFDGQVDGLVWFDVGCAGVIGGILALFLVFLQWFEKESKQHRFVLAAWLTIAVLVGNFLVPIIGGTNR